MSSGRGNIEGPEAARILSAPRGGRFEVVWVKARMPESDLQVLKAKTLRIVIKHK